MATLVLTAVGTAIGGPIGGALGALAGQQIDQNLLSASSRREGPRIQELSVQTSSYGTQIPRIFGRMRVAGSVIWATDLKETKNTEGGKGRPRTTTYSYSACFAVALSSRPVQKIGRIWADGKIFRGAAGDFKTPTNFRVFCGQEDQELDSLIASAEGINASPAYRGMTIAVFEDMELADYGNRIPSLTFEIFGDDGSVDLADIIDDISDQKISISSPHRLDGYAASGENRRLAISPIVDNYLLSFSVERGRILGCSRIDAVGAQGNIETNDFVAIVNGSDIARPQFEDIPEAKIPRQLALRYYDPERDYQSGLQASFRPGQSRIVVTRDFPAAIQATQAKQISQNIVWNIYRERSAASIEVPLHSKLARPGSAISLDDKKVWFVRNLEFRSGAASLSLTGSGTFLDAENMKGDSGRSISDVDALAGETRLALLDLPFAPEAPNRAETSAQLFAVAAGRSGWRCADLYRVLADGTLGGFVGKIRSPGTIGLMQETFAQSNAFLVDEQRTANVKLHHSGMTLSDADDNQLSVGKNVALIGQEIVQFAKAKPLGNGQYLLSKFHRGLGGTEHHIDDHSPDEPFILIESDTAMPIATSHFIPFQSVQFAAVGRNDANPVIAEIAYSGSALRPWQPVHLRHDLAANGDLEIFWTRRSRSGSQWLDHVNIPLSEENEEYIIRVEGSSQELLGEYDSTVPNFKLSRSQITIFQEQGINQIQLKVSQRGQYALSTPALLNMSI